MTIIILLAFVCCVIWAGYLYQEPSEIPQEILEWANRSANVASIGDVTPARTLVPDPAVAVLSPVGSSASLVSSSSGSFHPEGPEFNEVAAGQPG